MTTENGFYPYPMPTQNNGDLLGGGGIGSLLIGALLFGGGGIGGLGRGFGGGYGVGTPAASAVATDVVLNPAFQGIQNQISNLASQIASNTSNGYAAQNAIATNAAIDSNSRQILGEIGNSQTAQAAANFTTLQSLNGTLAAVTAQNNQNQLTTLNSFNQVNTAMLQGFNQQNIQSLNSFNQVGAALASIQNNSDRCCCEIKQAIHLEGETTRALINSNTMASLTAQLNDAKNQISDLNQTNVLIANNAIQTNTILSHMFPRPVVA
jgi:hypothetical protein